jgi:aconitase B
LHLNIEISLYDEEEFPPDGTIQIKDALKAWADIEYTIDKDVLVERLNIPIFEVHGIKTIVTREVAVTNNPLDTPTFQTTDIAIGVREKAIADTARIEVGVL